MKKHNKFTYGIIGLGRFGSALATRLAALGAEILVVDKDEEKVNEFREITENAFIASVLDKKTLYDIGIQNCDIVIVCIAELLDVSILTVMKLQAIGVKNIICTDISKDGAMKGTNIKLYKHLSTKFKIDITASGGVSSIEDIKNLKELNIYGAIIGKAYYIGAIDLKTAIEVAKWLQKGLSPA